MAKQLKARREQPAIRILPGEHIFRQLRDESWRSAGRERHEEQVLFSHYIDRLQAFLVAVPFPVQMFDRTGLTVMVNKAILDMLEIPDANRLVGRYNILKDPVVKRIGALRHLRRVFSGEVCITPDIVISPQRSDAQLGIRRQGEIFATQVFIPVIGPGGKVELVVALRDDITERVHTEQKLKTSETAFSSIMYCIPEAAMLIETDGTVVAANKGIAQPLGETVESIVGKNAFDILPPAESRERRRDLEEMVRRRAPVVHEIQREDRYLQMSVSPVFDRKNEVSRAAIFCTNITKRKLAEEQVKISEERMRALLEGASDLIEVVDEKGNIRYVSPSMKRILGYDHREPLGHPAVKIVHSEDLPKVQLLFEQVLRNPGRPAKVVCRCLHKNGTWRYLETWAKNNLANPAVGGIILNIRDISDHIRNQEIIRESEEKFRSIVEQSHDGITICDRNGAVIVYNRAQERLSGIPAPEAIGRKIWDLQHRCLTEQTGKRLSRDKMKRDFVRLHGGGKAVPGDVVESEMVRPDGTRVVVQSITSPIELATGTVYATYSRDVTRLRHTETSLRKRDNELSEQNLLLQQKNIAMRELMGQIEEEKKLIGERVVANVDRLISPVLDKLEARCGEQERVLLGLLEDTLRDLTAGFGCDISRKMYRLTQKEIEMCNMIRRGLTSKEIAGLLNISNRTVDTHRNRIRRKLDVGGPEVNLTTYLKGQMRSIGGERALAGGART